MVNAGFATEIITPAVGAPLAGYFNPRPSRGVLDELRVRAFVLEAGDNVGALAVCDLITVSPAMTQTFRARLRDGGAGAWADAAILAATHTHTGPYTQPMFGTGEDTAYLAAVAECAAAAVLRAWAGRRPSELAAYHAPDANDLAFNRRYWMKNGTVVTNPGKGTPDIVRPEGPVDRAIALLAVRQEGRLAGVLANLTNHTDTIGLDYISADWPGRMERRVRERLGEDVPVVTLVGCSGNINHFDVASDADQTSYAEARRIGARYGDQVADLLASGPCRAVPDAPLAVRTGTLEVVARDVAPDELARAREILARPAEEATGDLTSEGLAKGEGPVARFFAEQLVAFAADEAGKTRVFDWTAWRLGTGFALATLPGEPFTEIGLAIKAASPAEFTMVAELAMGSAGYIPLAECFGRGGYETLPVGRGGCRPDTAEHFIATLSRALAE